MAAAAIKEKTKDAVSVVVVDVLPGNVGGESSAAKKGSNAKV